ncbi:MAG: hypothetical protein M9924_01515 [Rhizobiaceae bacterium]|nr:hypothetical protein [Rhizobiaceae bacterium]
MFFIWDEGLLEPAMMGDDVLAFVRQDSAVRIARILNARANDDFGQRAICRTTSDLAMRRCKLVNDAGRAGVKITQR